MFAAASDGLDQRQGREMAQRQGQRTGERPAMKKDKIKAISQQLGSMVVNEDIADKVHMATKPSQMLSGRYM